MRQALGGLLWSKQFYHYDFDTAGSRVIRRVSGAAARTAPMAATTSGASSTMPTCFPCRTNGSIRGSRRGIWHSTAWPLPWSIPDFAKEQLAAAVPVSGLASQRPTACIRMGVFRHQSAGARVGSLARL